jgi:hypothetical protein
MRMLYDTSARCHSRMPFHAVVPWPVVTHDGHQLDWVFACTSMETWLETAVGHHWVDWTWDMFNLDNSKLCGVRFVREQDSVLFLLKWS